MNTPHTAAQASRFAPLTEGPVWAAIFSSLRNTDDEAGYQAAAERMLSLAAEQPGYLGAEGARGADGFGITVSYWASEAAIAAWRMHAEHTLVREQGRAHWYQAYTLRVARIERGYHFEPAAGPSDPASKP